MGNTCVGRNTEDNPRRRSQGGGSGEISPACGKLPPWRCCGIGSPIRTRRACAPFGLAKPTLARVEQAEADRSIAHQPAVGHFVDADQLSNQRRADVERAASPSDLTVVAYLPHLVRGRITRCLESSRVWPQGGGIEADRRLLSERLVGS